MNKEKFFKAYFWIIGTYDVLLGLSFALFFRQIYNLLGITLPNHPGFIYVPAWFLVSGGIGEFLIARNLYRNLDLAIVRLLMKLTFAASIFYCHFKYGIPNIFLFISILSILGIVKTSMFIKWVSLENQKR